MLVHRRLGDFEIIRPLGRGGMGEVYEAQQLNPPRRVALKVLAPWLTGSEEALERFWREAAVPAQLDHPNIVRIIATGKEVDGLAYYAMQLVRGISLTELMRKVREPELPATVPLPTVSDVAGETPSHVPHVPLPPATPPPVGEPPIVQQYRTDRFHTVARLGIQAARALADAHGKGFLHRDIKPSNLMVDHHSHLYLLDFGLTKACDPGAMGTRPGTVLGTPMFMSPEQARGERVDRRSDLYSLGVTLYQLLTLGSGPFEANPNDSERILEEVRLGKHVPLRKLVPEVPPELERIIRRATNVRPGRRYQDGSQLVVDLEGFLATSPSRPARCLSRPVRAKFAIALSIGVAALLVVGAVLRLFPQEDERNQPSGGNTGPAKSIPYDKFVRNRPWRTAVPLLQDDFQPLWHQRLLGDGIIHAMPPLQLALATHERTLVALDDDPENRWFEFTIELNTPLATTKQRRLIGVFFGWRTTSDNSTKYFSVEVNEKPSGQFPKGFFSIEAIRFQADTPSVHETCVAVVQLPLARSATWHEVTVRATKTEIAVTVDKNTTTVSAKQLAASMGSGFGVTLDGRGPLGIWAANNDYALFKKAFVKSLPDED